MIIRGLLDLVYLNFSAPFEEGPGLRQYIRQRSWLQRPLSILRHNKNSSEPSVPTQVEMLTTSLPHITKNLIVQPDVADAHVTKLAEPPVPSSPVPDQNSEGSVASNITQICDGDVNFQYEIDFIRGDLRTDTYNMTPGSANGCCLQCEMLESCTHWTWADNYCWLKNPPLAAKPKVRIDPQCQPCNYG